MNQEDINQEANKYEQEDVEDNQNEEVKNNDFQKGNENNLQNENMNEENVQEQNLEDQNQQKDDQMMNQQQNQYEEQDLQNQDKQYDLQQQQQGQQDLQQQEAQQQQQQQFNDQQVNPNEQQQIENDQIYKLDNQNNESAEDKISEEIEEKIKVLDEYIRDKSEEQTLNIRMHQLALAKILVFTHGKSEIKLVQAHGNLGEAYLNYKCYEQCIDHLTMAIQKNGKLFKESKENKILHAHLLSLLGRCYMEMGSNDDALNLLQKAYELNVEVYSANDFNNTPILTLLAKCYTQMKEYDQAHEWINKVWEIAEDKYGYRSITSAMTFIESAKIHALKGSYSSAIELQNRAIEMLIELNYDKPENLAEYYQQLSNYQEKNGDISGQIDSLNKVKTIYQETHDQDEKKDKKIIKIKRQISIILLRQEQHNEALEELYETEAMELKVYGENSIQVAKTQKIIGTILILTHKHYDAQRYLNKALKVFEENGMKKAVIEVKEKLKLAADIKKKQKFNQKQENDPESEKMA